MPQQKPTSVMVLGILGIIFALLGVCGLFSTAAVFMAGSSLGPNPAMDAMRNDTVYLAFAGVSVGLGLITTVLLLVSSIGSLALQPWARLGMLIYAGVTVVTTLVGSAF